MYKVPQNYIPVPAENETAPSHGIGYIFQFDCSILYNRKKKRQQQIPDNPAISQGLTTRVVYIRR